MLLATAEKFVTTYIPILIPCKLHGLRSFPCASAMRCKMNDVNYRNATIILDIADIG